MIQPTTDCSKWLKAGATSKRTRNTGNRCWKFSKGCAGTIVLAPSDISYGLLRMFQSVIAPDEHTAGSPFLPVRSHDELEHAIATIRGGLQKEMTHEC